MTPAETPPSTTAASGSPSPDPISDAPVLVTADGHLGRMTLNQPASLNALTLEMVRIISSALDQFETDPEIKTVLIDAVGERAFCAGGDIRSIYDAATAGTKEPLVFWQEEYHLNLRMARYPKPIVAVMDGIVMGGGVGVSAHCSHRIVTEHSMVAMPEVGIGFCPDVGGTLLLAQAPGHTGEFLGLTATRMGADDAIYAGFADRYFPREEIPAVIAQLTNRSVDEVLAEAPSPPEGTLRSAQGWIDAVFDAEDLSAMMTKLATLEADGADAARTAIDRHSPIAMSVALAAIRSARRSASLAECLNTEYRVSATFFDDGTEFIEGIRATVVDKDRNPRWDPATIGAVTPAMVERYFAPRPDDLELR